MNTNNISKSAPVSPNKDSLFGSVVETYRSAPASPSRESSSSSTDSVILTPTSSVGELPSKGWPLEELSFEKFNPFEGLVPEEPPVTIEDGDTFESVTRLISTYEDILERVNTSLQLCAQTADRSQQYRFQALFEEIAECQAKTSRPTPEDVGRRAVCDIIMIDQTANGLTGYLKVHKMRYEAELRKLRTKLELLERSSKAYPVFSYGGCEYVDSPIAEESEPTAYNFYPVTGSIRVVEVREPDDLELSTIFEELESDGHSSSGINTPSESVTSEQYDIAEFFSTASKTDNLARE